LPGVFAIDHDPIGGRPPLSYDELDRILCEVWPEWGGADRMWRPSASSLVITPDGVEPPPLGGVHGYAFVPDASKIPEIGEELFMRLWLAGYGYYVIGAAGQLLLRGVIDAQVWRPERLFFEAQPHVSDGITLKEPESVIYRGSRYFHPAGLGSADKAKYGALVDAEYRKLKPQAEPKQKAHIEKVYKEAKARGKPVKKSTLRKAVQSLTLSADYPIQLPDGSFVTVGEMLADPKKWHEQRFPDPLEPGSDKRIAVAYSDQEVPVVYSHVHGGITYRLERLETNGEDERPKLVTTTAAKLLEKPAPPRVWLCDPWMPGDDVTLTSGDGGVGKSTLALQQHWACATGRQWLGMNVKQCPSLYVSCEDPLRELHHRLEQFHDAELMSVPNLDRLHILDLTGEDALLCILDKGRIVMTDLFRQIEALIKEIGAGLVTLDASADVFGGDEINRGQVRAFVAQLRGVAIRETCAINLIAHASVHAMKTGRGYSGSTAWNNSVRSRLYFTKPVKEGGDKGEDGEGKELDPNLRRLELPKANRGPSGQAKPLRGRFVSEERPVATIEEGIADEELFLKLLDAFTQQKRPVSSSVCSTYAPSLFAEQAEARERGVTKKRFRAAMDRLFTSERITNEEWGPASKKHYRIVRTF
jgi:RecA-family ATPase